MARDEKLIVILASIAIILVIWMGIELSVQIVALETSSVRLNQEIEQCEQEIKQYKQEIVELEQEILELEQRLATKTGYITFEATAYDLSYDSCMKNVEDPWYGHTANGFDLRGLDWHEAMTIAVDPDVIPLGSSVEVIFPEPYSHMSGIYIAHDVGGAIQGARIDVFLGDFDRGNEKGMTEEVAQFGRREVQIRRLH